MVESIDIAPTILQTVDVEIPRKLQGKCITDQINGLVKWREYEFSEAVDLKMIRNKKWKLVYYQSCEYGELYDMENWVLCSEMGESLNE